jgi:hypothetical protein
MSKSGELSHEMLTFEGDKRIKTDLIARYLSWNKRPSYGGALKVGPQDYEFRIKATSSRPTAPISSK